jgi:hypothetical protein
MLNSVVHGFRSGACTTHLFDSSFVNEAFGAQGMLVSLDEKFMYLDDGTGIIAIQRDDARLASRGVKPAIGTAWFSTHNQRVVLTIAK